MDYKKLKRVERVVVHDNCPDGMASAIFLYDALGVEPEFLSYGQPAFENLEATPNTLFCDITPPHSRYKEWLGLNTIVLDHHRSAKELVTAFGDMGVFADENEAPGVSGAVLAYREVFRPVALEEDFFLSGAAAESKEAAMFAKLAGIRDTWQDDSPYWLESCEQAATLTFYPWEHWKRIIQNSNYDFPNEMNVGRLVYAKRLSDAARCAENALRFEEGGFKVAVFNDPDKLTSDTAEALRTNYGVNVIAGFYFAKDDDNSVICYSLRSDGSLDVSALCEYYGGGGHLCAAGFSQEIDLEVENPFSEFRNMFKEYINFGR